MASSFSEHQKGPGNKIVSSVSQHAAFFKMANTGKEKTPTTVQFLKFPKSEMLAGDCTKGPRVLCFL